MHAHDRVAPEHQPAIHQDVNTVVRPGVHVDRLRVRQVPEAAPFHAEQSPRQRGIFIQKREADLRGAILEQRLAGKADVRIERANEARWRRDHPVQDSTEGRQR